MYGPRQRLRDNLQGFLPIFVRRALSGEPITVFGDGAQERDCLYVDDVVECLLLTARSAEAPGEVFNVGNDERLSLRAIAEAIVAAAGSGSIESVPWPHDRDAIDIGSYYGDSSKAKRCSAGSRARRSPTGSRGRSSSTGHPLSVPVTTSDGPAARGRPRAPHCFAAARARRGGRAGPALRAVPARSRRPRPSRPSSPRSAAGGTPSPSRPGPRRCASLRALGVGIGDEVVVPAFTAVPTAAAVCATGAVPVFVDVERDTAMIDPQHAAAAVTERTRAVIPVHLYGRPAAARPRRPGARRRRPGPRRARSADPSAAAAYSFYPTKNLGRDRRRGSAVVTDDADLAAQIRLLRAQRPHRRLRARP